MARAAGECDIPHVGNLLIVFRRPASAGGAQRHAATATAKADARPAGGGSRRGADPEAAERLGGDVRLLRLRSKVPSPRG